MYPTYNFLNDNNCCHLNNYKQNKFIAELSMKIVSVYGDLKIKKMLQLKFFESSLCK